jgi:hypothetical protein
MNHNPTEALKRRQKFDQMVKRYHNTKLYVHQPQQSKRQLQLRLGKAPYHSVMGEAYHKTTNGKPFFCGARMRN